MTATIATKPGELASRKRRQQRTDRFEEARFLMAYGTHPDEIAARLGTTRRALQRQTDRWGAHDIRQYVTPGGQR